jgi:hypothetical protein
VRARIGQDDATTVAVSPANSRLPEIDLKRQATG